MAGSVDLTVHLRVVEGVQDPGPHVSRPGSDSTPQPGHQGAQTEEAAMATLPYVFQCSKDAGFMMNPNEQKRFGYVTALKASIARLQRCGCGKPHPSSPAPASVALAALG